LRGVQRGANLGSTLSRRREEREPKTTGEIEFTDCRNLSATTDLMLDPFDLLTWGRGRIHDDQTKHGAVRSGFDVVRPGMYSGTGKLVEKVDELMLEKNAPGRLSKAAKCMYGQSFDQLGLFEV